MHSLNEPEEGGGGYTGGRRSRTASMSFKRYHMHLQADLQNQHPSVVYRQTGCRGSELKEEESALLLEDAASI